MASSQRTDHLHIFSELDDPERQALITELVRKVPSFRYVSRYGFWHLWFLDIPLLKRAIENAEREERSPLQAGSYRPRSLALVRTSAPTDSFGIRSPHFQKGPLQTTQSITASEQAALNRDKNQCVLMKRDHNQSHPAYIFPARFHGIMTLTMESSEWWRYEAEFGKQRVQKWQDAIQTSVTANPPADSEKSGRMHNTDRPQNMITLDKKVQRYWEDDLCVFRAISLSEDKSTMELAFHWLPMPKEGKPLYQKDGLFLRHHPYPNRRMGYDDSPGNGIHLYDADGKSICSGQIFTITTDDPVHKPLPSMDLLDMQWMIKRSSRFRGCRKSWRTNLSDITEDDDYYSLFRGKKWNPRARDWLYDDDQANEQERSEHDNGDNESEYSGTFSDCSHDEDYSDEDNGNRTINIGISVDLQSNKKKPHKDIAIGRMKLAIEKGVGY